jgi:hypothetical protein
VTRWDIEGVTFRKVLKPTYVKILADLVTVRVKDHCNVLWPLLLRLL